MTSPLNYFVTERNVDIYMSRLSEVRNTDERDNLLRPLVAEEDLMGKTQEHLETASVAWPTDALGFSGSATLSPPWNRKGSRQRSRFSCWRSWSGRKQ